MSSICIIFFLLSIFLKQLQNQTEAPTILLAIDNSSSINTGMDSIKIKKGLIKKIADFKKNIGEKFTVKTLLFGSKTITSELEPTFSEKATDINQMIEEVANNYTNQNIGAMVIVSDGIYNTGANPINNSEKLGYPIYTLAMGDSTEIKDVAIQKVNYNQVSYFGNQFPVEVLINSKKFSGKEVVVSIYQNGIQIFKQQVKITKSNFFSVCNFTLNSNLIGLIKYTAKVSILDGEKNISNNSQTFFIEVIDNREKIALLANTPHPDVMAIKESILNISSYELEYALASEFINPIKAYSLIILHGYSSEQMKLILDCKTNSVPVWIINPTILENLPGIKINGSNIKSSEVESYVNKSFGLFSLSEGLVNFTKELPPVKTFFGDYKPSNGSVSLINQRIGDVETENTIFNFIEIDGLKNACFLGDGLWAWKMRDFAEHNNHNLFNELICKTIQYLSVKGDKSFFRVNSPKICYENEVVEMQAEVYNKSYELVPELEVNLVLINSENKKFNYTFSKTNLAYKLNLGTLPAGEYHFQATVKNSKDVYTKQGDLIVRQIVGETMNTVANHEVLFQLANRTKGQLFYPSEWEQLQTKILANENIKTITYSQINTTELIDFYWLFFLILFLLGLEWFLRKRFMRI